MGILIIALIDNERLFLGSLPVMLTGRGVLLCDVERLLQDLKWLAMHQTQVDRDKACEPAPGNLSRLHVAKGARPFWHVLL